jgi:proline dehydrogenase
MGVLTFFARRFVAGETAADAVAAARRMNQRGIRGILDFLGEHVTSAEDARAAVEEYIRLLDTISAAGVGASISLKASQMGVLVSPDLCLENLSRVAQHAAQSKNTLWLDMEESALTQKTIDVFERLRANYPNVGLCLQAYLVRTGGDLDRLMREPLRVRLCKGAYKEPPEIAYATRRAVDGNYRMLALKLIENMARGTYPAFATHDRSLIQEIISQVRQKGIDPTSFEFEMLYGIENTYLAALSQQGFQAKVYIPYGTHWLPYFMRRLRERKENIYFLMRNIFKV